MKKLLGHIPFIKIFLDDILVFSNTREEHVARLNTVLKVFKENNIITIPEKCSFLKSEVSYLGRILSERGIEADTSRLPDFSTIKPPRTRKAAQKLLGYINWFRNFIPNLSIKMTGLTQKLSTKEEFKWTVVYPDYKKSIHTRN